MMKTHRFSETTILYLTKYHSVLDQLYVELEEHIQDLININWNVNSTSPYLSPAVSVWKKNETLRLRCNYRKSNGKAIPDSYPLPKMQQILENLG